MTHTREPWYFNPKFTYRQSLVAKAIEFFKRKRIENTKSWLDTTPKIRSTAYPNGRVDVYEFGATMEDIKNKRFIPLKHAN